MLTSVTEFRSSEKAPFAERPRQGLSVSDREPPECSTARQAVQRQVASQGEQCSMLYYEALVRCHLRDSVSEIPRECTLDSAVIISLIEVPCGLKLSVFPRSKGNPWLWNGEHQNLPFLLGVPGSLLEIRVVLDVTHCYYMDMSSNLVAL